MKYTAKFRTTPLTQAAGAKYFAMDLDEAPAARRPRSLREPPYAARSARHSGCRDDFVPFVPVLNVMAPQVGEDDVVAYLDSLTLLDVEHEIFVPTISWSERIMPRSLTMCSLGSSWRLCLSLPLVWLVGTI